MMKFSKNKNPFKLIVFCSFIVSIVVLLSVLFRLGYIPVLGNIIAEKKISNYANTQITKSKFDWKNSRYVSTLENGYNLSYKLQHNTIHDEQMSNEVNIVALNDYQSIIEKLPSNLEFPESISVWTSINADDYTKKAQRLYLLGIYNTDSLSEEESLKIPANIAQNIIELMGKEYNFTGIQLIYADKNGIYEISIPANTFDAIEYEKLLENTKKYSEQKLPLDYLEWLKKHRES